MRIELWLKETNTPIVYEDATSTYTKGPLWIVYERSKQRATKWPLDNIWRIIEDYPDSDRRTIAQESSDDA